MLRRSFLTLATLVPLSFFRTVPIAKKTWPTWLKANYLVRDEWGQYYVFNERPTLRNVIWSTKPQWTTGEYTAGSIAALDPKVFDIGFELFFNTMMDKAGNIYYE